MDYLPTPRIVRCYFENTVRPAIPAMELHWDPDAPGAADRSWHLPGGVTLKGAAPTYFGVTVHRHGPNAYRVQLLWDSISFCWNELSRVQIMSSSLAHLLRALGTDLWYLLQQSPEAERAAA